MDWFVGIAALIALVASVVAHELGHLGVARLGGCGGRLAVQSRPMRLFGRTIGVPVRASALFEGGNGTLTFEDLPRRWQAAAAAAGPAVNAVIAAVALVQLGRLPGWTDLFSFAPPSVVFVAAVASLNLAMVVGNLFPLRLPSKSQGVIVNDGWVVVRGLPR